MQTKDNAKPQWISLFGQELFRLTAFFTFLAFYYLFVNDDGDVIITTPLKCGPIISLMAFVYLKGFKTSAEFSYSQMIMAGLVCSCFGDIFLNINLFPHGMAAFAVAQCCYIVGFEMEPWKFHIGIPLYLLALGMTVYVYPTLDTVLKVGLPVYAFLLITMCWRCIVRATERGGILAPACAVGSVLFVISDTLICVSMFITPIPNARIHIMNTYYAAQFLIAISTMSDVLKPPKAKGSKKLSRKYRAQD